MGNEIKEILDKIVYLDVADFYTFIDKRKSKMVKVDSFCPSERNGRAVKEPRFFDENSKLVCGYTNLIMDDDLAYVMLISAIKNAANVGDIYSDETIFKVVQKTVYDYLGYGNCNEVNKMLAYKKAVDAERDLLISDFRHTNMGTCTERSLLAHNFFKLLGYESFLIFQNIYINGRKEFHAFNAVKRDASVYLYDLINTAVDKYQPLPPIVVNKLSGADAVRLMGESQDIESVAKNVYVNVGIKNPSSLCYGESKAKTL